jgi:hypothetical protein
MSTSDQHEAVSVKSESVVVLQKMQENVLVFGFGGGGKMRWGWMVLSSGRGHWRFLTSLAIA